MKTYLVYRPLYTKVKGLSTMIQPGAKIKCAPVEAMCINTMQPMTLRGIKEEDYRVETECTCKIYEWESHSCPFQYDIWDNDDENYCNCCPFCEQQCADDI